MTSAERFLVDHIKSAGERQLESLLEEVDERRQRLDACAERTQQQVESGTDTADWPATNQQQQQPDERPTDTSHCHLCTFYHRPGTIVCNTTGYTNKVTQTITNCLKPIFTKLRRRVICCYNDNLLTTTRPTRYFEISSTGIRPIRFFENYFHEMLTKIDNNYYYQSKRSTPLNN